MSEIYIGIDLGGTNVKMGCFDSDINFISQTSIPTDAHMGPETVIDNIAIAIEKLLEQSGLANGDVRSAGIGVPGPAKYKEGIIIECGNLPKFKNGPFRQILSDKLGKPVVFENDANVACWGEYAMGAGKGRENMVFFTLGTGIGGGIIQKGELLEGSGDNAAELGHIIIHGGGRLCGCGQRGCVEAYSSAMSTAKRAEEAVREGQESSLGEILGEKGRISCKEVFEHAAGGDAVAAGIVDCTANGLAILCINMLHVTEPACIVFAGGMIGAGNQLLDAIKRHFMEQIWNLKNEPVEICFATLGENAGIIGAAALAKKHWK